MYTQTSCFFTVVSSYRQGTRKQGTKQDKGQNSFQVTRLKHGRVSLFCQENQKFNSENSTGNTSCRIFQISLDWQNLQQWLTTISTAHWHYSHAKWKLLIPSSWEPLSDPKLGQVKPVYEISIQWRRLDIKLYIYMKIRVLADFKIILKFLFMAYVWNDNCKYWHNAIIQFFC